MCTESPIKHGSMMLNNAMPPYRDGKKRWALGCVIPHPGILWPRGKFT